MGDKDDEEFEEAPELPPGAVPLQRSIFEWVKDDVSSSARNHQTITSDEVARSHGIPQREFMRYLKNEIAEADACFSLPFTLVFVCAFAVMAIAHDDAITRRAVEGALQDDIYNNARFSFTYLAAHKNIDDVASFADFWSWLRLGLLPLLFKQNREFHEGWQNIQDSPYATTMQNISGETIPPDRRGFWLSFHRIVGGIRITQEHAQVGTCSSLEILLPLYNSECFGGLEYSLRPEVGLPLELAQSTAEPQAEKWIWVTTDLGKMQEDMIELERSGYLSRKTKKLEIAIPTYNAEFGLHTLTRINFWFSRGGHIWKRIIPMSQYSDWHDRWYYIVYDIFWLACIAYMIGVELVQIQLVLRTKGCNAMLTDYFNVWNLIDWASILSGVAIVIVFIASISMRTEMNETLESLGDQGFSVTGEFYRNTVADYVEKLQNNVNYVRHLRLSVGIYPLVIVIRLFRSFSAQPKLALVTRTLSLALPDLFHFSIVFGAVFVTFSVTGIVLFGREVPSFTTFPSALASCFRIMLGDIDWEELSAVGRAEASVWLWLYVIVVVLLMLNMIVAIIMDHYSSVKAASGNSESIWEEAFQMWYRWRGKRNGTYVPLPRVLDALHDQQRRDKLNKLAGSRKADVTAGEALEELFGIGQSMAEVTNSKKKSDEGILTISKLRNIVNRASKTKMTEEQAFENIRDAIEEYYEENKKGAELDEVLQLTQQVNTKVKRLVRLSRKAHEERDTAPVHELEAFGEDLVKYLDEVRQEREDNRAKLEAAKKEKKELESRLVLLGGGFVKMEHVSMVKRDTITRTASRLRQRPPNVESV